MPRATVRILRPALIILIALGLPAATLARTDPAGGTGGGPLAGSLQVRVIRADTGDPLEGAFVMAGPRPGTPFEGNWGFTSATGEINFSDPALQGPVTVTAGAEGFAYFTIVAVNASDLVLPLRESATTAPTYQVGDYVSGIDVDNGSFNLGDGYIDMAMVLPTLKLEDLMSFDLASIMGPPEIIQILGQPFEVPSNIFIPSQYELLIEIVKDHYYLYLTPGPYTLTAISGRVSRDALLNAGSIFEIIPLISWREIDLLDIMVSGDMYNADLFVDPDLSQTVTLNLANVPEDWVAWCVSLGDLDNRAGLGRLVPLGFNSLSCPGGSGPCSGTVQLSTVAASGEFAGLTYFPAVALQSNTSNDMLALMQRAPHARTYTENMTTFFQPLDLVYDGGHFIYSDAQNPVSGSPPVDLGLARLTAVGGPETYWEFMLSGATHEFEAPRLPPEAPPGPQVGTVYTWNQVSLGLDYDLPSFDFDAFAFSDILAHGSHLAGDALDVPFQADPVGVSQTAPLPGRPVLTGRPNPFREETAIRFEIEREAPVRLAVYAPEGRKVATLLDGRLSAGAHEISWRGVDDQGRRLPGGLYLARLTTAGQSRTWRILLQTGKGGR